MQSKTEFEFTANDNQQPSTLKRLAGFFLLLLGIIGSILTSPFSILGSLVGLLIGLGDFENLLAPMITGAKIGSLGFINAILFGIELAFNTGITPEPSNTVPTIDVTSTTVINTKLEEIKKPSLTQEYQQFLEEIHRLIAEEDTKVAIKQVDESSNVKEKYIDTLIEVIKNRSSKNDFWERLNVMSTHDIRVFISKLSPIKEGGKFSLSALDYLWMQFQGLQFEPTLREMYDSKLSLMIEALSEEQFKASLDSATFMNIFRKDSFAVVAANTLNRKQLEFFASDFSRHGMLDNLIKKLKPGPQLLGKLVSIMPFATILLKNSIIEQLDHLAQPPSFKIKLIKIAQRYININENEYKQQREREKATVTKTETYTSKKWKTVNADTRPIYKNLTVERINWNDADFEAFMNNFHAGSIIENESKFITDLNSLPDNRIKMLVERAASLPNYKHLLKFIWQLDKRTINGKSYIDCRTNRLKIILENLSEDQLKEAVEDLNFWEIFRNTQEPYCEMLANTLTPIQFETMISSAAFERHADFAMIIKSIKYDSKEEAVRIQQIIEKTIHYTTPWIALELDKQITKLIKYNKALSEQFHNDLKIALTKSLEKPDIGVKYYLDKTINKQDISRLLLKPTQNNLNPSNSFIV